MQKFILGLALLVATGCATIVRNPSLEVMSIRRMDHSPPDFTGIYTITARFSDARPMAHQVVVQVEFVPARTISSRRGGVPVIDAAHPMLVTAATQRLAQQSGEIRLSFATQDIQPKGMVPTGKVRVRVEQLPPPALAEVKASLPSDEKP